MLNNPFTNPTNLKKVRNFQVISGADRESVGKVISTYPKTGRIRVSRVNIMTKHVKPTQDGESGKIRKSEGVIDHSNVMHWSDFKKLRSRVGKKYVNEQKFRYLIKTGEILA